MSNYTPGPWAVDERNGCEVFQVDGGGPIAIAGDWYPRSENHPVENMRLIAAAPELLEALKEMLGVYLIKVTDEVAIEQARAAIKKATGEAA